ncbi:MAG: hypothetical protein K1X79_13170 [Oligoflexia bacterium]|nr:hypothetical protein [Oligoflexia bacterium]
MNSPALSQPINTEIAPSNASPGKCPRAARLVELFFLSALAIYAYLFVKSISPFWFNPEWTTDDGVQQLFPFYAVLEPKVWHGDLVFEMMRGYLAPLHFGLGATLTLLTKSPIMTGHAVMLVQFLLAAVFLFLAVRKAAGIAPALFSLIWLLHTRSILQRMTGGLPRGWAVPLISAYFYFVLAGRHRAVLLVLLCGCLLNPPATFLLGAAYGLHLVWGSITKETRPTFKRPLLELCLATPILLAVTLAVTQRPQHIGHVLSLSEASELPEMSRSGGRFSFLPFQPWPRELREYGMRAFLGKKENPPPFLRASMPFISLGLLTLLVFSAKRQRREYIPGPILIFGLASLIVYFISRPLAFYLYVPDRHLNIPLALFFISAFSIGIWRALVGPSSQRPLVACAGLLALGTVLYACTGLGLKGEMNFNYNSAKRGAYPTWLREHTPETALIAGHPTMVDPVPLFARRRVYASSETWHPFYSGYNIEMKRRLSIALRAHYSHTLNELYSILASERIDYFVFDRRLFYPAALQKAGYFMPLNDLVRELTQGDPAAYAYRELPEQVNLDKYPFMPYRDRLVAIVDVAKLGEFLSQQTTVGAS